MGELLDSSEQENHDQIVGKTSKKSLKMPFWDIFRTGFAYLVAALFGNPVQHMPVTILGNGRDAVSRVLLRKRDLTEFCGKLGEFCKKLGEFALAHT